MGQLHSFSEFGSNRNLIDASVYGEDWTSFVGGLQDGTEVTGQVLYDPADTGAADLIDSYTNSPDTVVTFTATHVASGAAFTISAILSQLTWESALDGLFAMNFTAKIVNPGVQVAS